MQSDYLYSKNDVFSEDLRLDILKSSEKHFANNLVDGDNGIYRIELPKTGPRGVRKDVCKFNAINIAKK